MKKLPQLKASFLLTTLFLSFFQIGLAQKGKQTETKPTDGARVAQSDKADDAIRSYVSRDKAIHIQTYLGPFGKAYIPPEITARKEVFEILKEGKTELDAEKYFFPSLYFVISAKPNISITQNNPKKRDGGEFIDYEFSKTGQSLKWMRVSITVEPVMCGAEETGEFNPDGSPKAQQMNADSVKVMAVSPEETDELLNEQKPAQIARVGDEMVNKLIPFAGDDATAPLPTKLTAISGAVSILFKNLFPPRAVAYSYAFIDSPTSGNDNTGVARLNKDTFGWYWRQKNVETAATSIVGLRRSVAFLQVKRGVKALKIRYRIDAKWSGDYSDNVDDEYVDADSIPYSDTLSDKEEFNTVVFHPSFCQPPPPAPNFFAQQDYDFLGDIDDFPMLIPKEVTCNIFHKEIAPLYPSGDDVIDPRRFLLDLNKSDKPLYKAFWEGRKSEIWKKITKDKKADFPANAPDFETAVGKLRPESVFKQILADELGIALKDREGKFYRATLDYLKNNRLTAAEIDLWDEATKYAESRKLILFYRKFLARHYAESLRDYQPADECSEWFTVTFPAKDVTVSSGNKFVRREVMKEKLDLPTLRQEIEALKNLIRPTPTPKP